MAFVRASWPSSEGARLFGPPRAKRDQGQYKSLSPADPQPGRLLLIRICSSQDVQDIEALRHVSNGRSSGMCSMPVGASLMPARPGRTARIAAWPASSQEDC